MLPVCAHRQLSPQPGSSSLSRSHRYPLQLKQLLSAEFRSLGDFKAKAGQYKPHNTQPHWDKPPKAGHHHKGPKQHAAAPKGAANGVASPKDAPAAAKQSVQAASNGGPPAKEPVAAASG